MLPFTDFSRPEGASAKRWPHPLEVSSRRGTGQRRLRRPLVTPATARVRMDKLDGGAANRHSLLDELYQGRVARASPQEMNAPFLHPQPNGTTLSAIGVPARH